MAEITEDGDLWMLNHGYYGRQQPGTKWVIHNLTKPQAETLKLIENKITAAVAENGTKMRPAIDKLTVQYPITGPAALVLGSFTAGDKKDNKARLRASRTPAGWVISEYDYNAWTTTLN